MSDGKKLHVVAAPQAGKIIAAEGKVRLMERVRALSDDGEKVVAALLRVMRDGKDRDVVDAAKVILAYGWGKPIETLVTADVTQASGGANVAALSTEQLEAVVNARLAEPKAEVVEEEDAEIVSS